MTLYDMHCHLGFFPDPAAAAQELAAAGVSGLCATVTPGEYASLAPVLADARNARVGVGLHPWWLADGRAGPPEIERAQALIAKSRYVAEIGLDFADRCRASAKLQLMALDAELAACRGGGHVLSVHAVRSATAVLDALERHHTLEGNTVIFHWFSGSSEELFRARRAGCLFSVNGFMLATRRGREYSRQLPPAQLLLETDLPGPEERGLDTPRALISRLKEAAAVLSELHGPETCALISAQSERLLS